MLQEYVHKTYVMDSSEKTKCIHECETGQWRYQMHSNILHLFRFTWKRWQHLFLSHRYSSSLLTIAISIFLLFKLTDKPNGKIFVKMCSNPKVLAQEGGSDWDPDLHVTAGPFLPDQKAWRQTPHLWKSGSNFEFCGLDFIFTIKQNPKQINRKQAQTNTWI